MIVCLTVLFAALPTACSVRVFYPVVLSSLRFCFGVIRGWITMIGFAVGLDEVVGL